MVNYYVLILVVASLLIEGFAEEKIFREKRHLLYPEPGSKIQVSQKILGKIMFFF